MKPNGNLQRAIMKAEQFERLSRGKMEKNANTARTEYCGCFTASEVLALIDAGVTPTDSQDWIVERAKKDVKTGDNSCGHWFYFYPNGLKMRH